MKVVRRLSLSVVLAMLAACSVQSGGEQAPLYEGDGVVINDGGDDGRTLSVDASRVPMVETCTAGQVVQRTADGWACADGGGGGGETDPTVNALGKATLSCGSGDSLTFNGTTWVCTGVGSAVVAAGYPTAAALTTLNAAALIDRVVALEGDLAGLSVGTIFADTFARANGPLGQTETPTGGVWLASTGAGVAPVISSGAFQRPSADTANCCVTAYAPVVRPRLVSRSARLRFVLGRNLPAGSGTAMVSIQSPAIGMTLSFDAVNTWATFGGGGMGSITLAPLVAGNNYVEVVYDSYTFAYAYSVSTSGYGVTPFISGQTTPDPGMPMMGAQMVTVQLNDAYDSGAANYSAHATIGEISIEQL